jgi:hypothetical protein
VTSHEFFFALALSGGASREMLTELVGRVLERAGCPGDGAAAIAEKLHAAVANGSAGSGGIDVEFTAGAGRLKIAVSSPTRSIWHTVCDIP